jgi:hypothetical protein
VIPRGHTAVAALVSTQNYRGPGWVKVPDLEQQRQAAIEAALAEVDKHDAVIRKMVSPRPLVVRITTAR